MTTNYEKAIAAAARNGRSHAVQAVSDDVNAVLATEAPLDNDSPFPSFDALPKGRRMYNENTGKYDFVPEGREPGDDATQPEHGGKHAIEFSAISSKVLFETDYPLDYLIDGLFVRGQPGGLFGGKKSLKTTVMIDLALSLSIGGRFLNRFQVNQAVRVGVMSGESGAATIKETAIRQATSRGRVLSDFAGVYWGFELPTLGNLKHLEALKRFITGYEIEVLMIDPMYLCMPIGDAASNLFAVGALLKGLTELGQETGCTLLLCHHTRKGKVDPFSPPELEDIAWAGFQEWVRQWFLVGRREGYDPEQGGSHKLWLNVGGSAGHSGLWAVNIDEGTRQDPSGRRWDVEVLKASEARGDAIEQQQQQRDANKDAKATAKMTADRNRVTKGLKVKPDGDTRRSLRERIGMTNERLTLVLENLIESGDVVTCDVQIPNRKGTRTVEGVRLKPITEVTGDNRESNRLFPVDG